MIKFLLDFLRGLAFGITETVPGVSGGTIAIVLGFYNELIESVNHFTEDPKKYLKFFIPLLIGAAAGVFLFSSLISFMLTNYSLPSMTLFIGLITGIIPHIFAKTRGDDKKIKLKNAALTAAPFVLLIMISHLKGTSGAADPAEAVRSMGTASAAFIFFAGILAASALIIPGVSGSFVLLLLGVYPVATYSVSSIGAYLTDIGNVGLFLDIVKVLGPLAAGVAVGGLSTARLIEKLLKDHGRTVYSIILGLLAGSVYALFNEPIVYRSGVSASAITAGALTFAAGAAISFAAGRKRL